MQFKSIPFVAKVKQSAATKDVANQLQSMIDAQATNGWAFEAIETVKTIVQPSQGCFGLGAKPMEIAYNSVATFTKSGKKEIKTNDIEEINAIPEVAHEVSLPLAIIPEMATGQVAKESIIEDDVVSENIDYSTIFRPLAKQVDNVLTVNDSDAHSVQEPFVAAPTPSLMEQINPVIEWVKSNKKLLIFAIIGLLISFVVYKLLQPKPLEEAKKAVEVACKCEQDKTTQLIGNLVAFNNSFEAAQFPTQIEARNAYNNAVSGTITAYNNCKSQADNDRNTLLYKFSNFESIAEFNNIYDNLFNTSYKGDMNEYQRISGLIEGKISALRVDYNEQLGDGSIENTAQYQRQLLITALQNTSGTLMIEPNILNVRDKPSIDGNIIFKAERGTVYKFNNQYTDDRNVIWYEIDIDGQRGWVSGLYSLIQGIEGTVADPQSFFYDLDYNTLAVTKRNQYLESGQKTVVLKKLNDFIYTQYTNSQGITTKGWLNINSLMQ